MTKEDIEQMFKIKVPNMTLLQIGAEITYKDPYSGKTSVTAILSLYSFISGPFPDLPEISDYSYYSIPVFEEKMILPFGEDGGGYMFCLDYRDNKIRPKIVLWIRENDEPFDIVVISEDFEDFLKKSNISICS